MVSIIQLVVLIVTLHQVASVARYPVSRLHSAPTGDDEGNLIRTLKISKSLMSTIPIFTPANLTVRCDYNKSHGYARRENLSSPILMGIQQAKEEPHYFSTLVSSDVVLKKTILNNKVDARRLPDETQVHLGGENEDAFIEATWINPSSIQQGTYQCIASFINKDTGEIENKIMQSRPLFVHYGVNLDSVSEAYEETLGEN